MAKITSNIDKSFNFSPICVKLCKTKQLVKVIYNNNNNKSLVWDVTVVCPLADSYVASAAREAGSVAE